MVFLAFISVFMHFLLPNYVASDYKLYFVQYPSRVWTNYATPAIITATFHHSSSSFFVPDALYHGNSWGRTRRQNFFTVKSNTIALCLYATLHTERDIEREESNNIRRKRWETKRLMLLLWMASSKRIGRTTFRKFFRRDI